MRERAEVRVAVQCTGLHFLAMRGGSSSAISIALHTIDKLEEARGKGKKHLIPSDQTSARPS
jgi:hypothetical protein